MTKPPIPNKDPHSWEECPLCGWMVVCGYCGNNCCNGGSGRTTLGKDCDCDEAYDLQYKGWELEKDND